MSNIRTYFCPHCKVENGKFNMVLDTKDGEPRVLFECQLCNTPINNRVGKFILKDIFGDDESFGSYLN